MIAGNAMTTIGLCYRNLNSLFRDQRQQILEKLSLGANPNQASRTILRETIKSGMQPSLDSAKTVGIVSLPGMMSGLMFAGTVPMTAIMYQIMVTFTERVLGRKFTVVADSLCLGTGFLADDESTEDLAMIFRLPRTPDGYFLEEHVKLRPVDLPVPGFFVAGTAHAPKSISESIAQAQAAAGRAQTLLARDVINLGAAVAKVESKRCAACLICVRACPFNVPFINADGYSEIDPAKCHGCGVCAAECPAKAIQLMQFEDDQIMAKLDGLFERIAI